MKIENSKKYALIFISIALGAIIFWAAFFIHSQRPFVETKSYQPQVSFVRATGKCAECHRNETSAIVHLFENSVHIKKGINCMDCHQAHEGQESFTHKGFNIAKKLTAKNCASCHATEYRQFIKSRHGAPAWAAVTGSADFSKKQLAEVPSYHKSAVFRDHNKLILQEGKGIKEMGCMACHNIGKPNKDGSIGTCIQCHSKHNPTVALARKPQTCAQCHMGPDHSQIEIYTESKHGVLYNHLRDKIHFNADPKNLTTKDFPVPTCATCHMSGLEGMNVTHDTTERLSLYLFAPITTKRPNFEQQRGRMQETCLKCHAKGHVEDFYKAADVVVESTNEQVAKSKSIMDALRAEGLLTKKPFDEPIEFVYFDLWHYYGRTAKHGAFMGGPDFVQWHGGYEILLKLTKLKDMAKKLRKKGHHDRKTKK